MSGISLGLISSHNKVNNKPWIIDTGATDHIVCDNTLYTHVERKIVDTVSLPNGRSAPVTHSGTVKIGENILLKGVLCVPSFEFNLISVQKLAKSMNCNMIFTPKTCFVQDPLTKTTIGVGEAKQGLYHLFSQMLFLIQLFQYQDLCLLSPTIRIFIFGIVG